MWTKLQIWHRAIFTDFGPQKRSYVDKTLGLAPSDFRRFQPLKDVICGQNFRFGTERFSQISTPKRCHMWTKLHICHRAIFTDFDHEKMSYVDKTSDLAPSDFRRFWLLKEVICGQNFRFGTERFSQISAPKRGHMWTKQIWHRAIFTDFGLQKMSYVDKTSDLTPSDFRRFRPPKNVICGQNFRFGTERFSQIWAPKIGHMWTKLQIWHRAIFTDFGPQKMSYVDKTSDLAPRDFHRFRPLKEIICGQNFRFGRGG